MHSGIERVALVKWQDSDGKSDAIQRELETLGCRVVPFRFDQAVPLDVDMVLTFAPHSLPRAMRSPKRVRISRSCKEKNLTIQRENSEYDCTTKVDLSWKCPFGSPVYNCCSYLVKLFWNLECLFQL